MDYHLAFWMLVAFLAGRAFPRKFYVGHDETKYNAADCGILLNKRR